MSSSTHTPGRPSLAGTYADGESARLHAVTVTLDADILALDGEGVAVRWQVPRLHRLPDRPDGAAVISEKGSDARLWIAPGDRDVLRTWFPRLFAPGRTRRGTLILGSALTGIAVASLAFLFVGLPLLSRPLAHTVPLDVERRMGEQTNQMVTWFTDECETGEEARAALDSLGSRLYAVSDSPFEFRLRIVDAGFPNAFALPGGRILVTDELIDEMESPDELAGVLAHEAAHVAQRHVMAAQLREMGFGVLLELLIGGGSGAGQEIARTGATLESLRHTRGAESEADDYALQYLVAADMNPHGLADFFERMQTVLEGEAEAEAEDAGADADLPAEDASEPSAETGDARNDRWLSSVLRTHPDTRARAERARAAAEQIGWSGEPALDEAEWAALQAVCSDGPIPGNTPLERVRDRIGDVLKPEKDGEDAGE
ncbi:M48 family metallopeptidase [Maricaulis sp.]|uniref:M48 family metallopeptidase n=1 Tax=Maricaulis sp. TaxID=1486257 RepID=UPI003298B149